MFSKTAIEIREIQIDSTSSVDALDGVNTLLDQGWVLISVQQRGYMQEGEAFFSTVYVLGKSE